MTEQTLDYALERGLTEAEIVNMFAGEHTPPADDWTDDETLDL